jgi:hypothetical protein
VGEVSEKQVDFYEFPTCLHVFSAALHREGVEPSSMTIEMPFDQWWKLSQKLQSKFKDLMFFDGRQKELAQFQYMGFKFRVKK